MKMIKKILLILPFFLLGSYYSAFAETGEATEYKIRMVTVNICEDGSSGVTCVNPVTLGTGRSSLIDIANTNAGAAAASYGDVTAIPRRITYTMMQVVLEREVQIKGVAGSCYTVAGNNGNYSAAGAAIGSTDSADLGATIVVMGLPGTGRGNDIQSSNNTDGSSPAGQGVITAGHKYLVWMGSFTKPVTITTRIPTIKLAFGTDNALELLDKSGCASNTGGLIAGAVDVTMTLE